MYPEGGFNFFVSCFLFTSFHLAHSYCYLVDLMVHLAYLLGVVVCVGFVGVGEFSQCVDGVEAVVIYGGHQLMFRLMAVSLFGSCRVDYVGDQDFLVLFEHGVDIVRYGGGGVAFGCFVVVGGVGFKFLLRFD